LLSLSIVTAVPLAGFTDPAELIFTSSAAPDLTVELWTGFVTAVAIVVSA
jgi:hypothetical protein